GRRVDVPFLGVDVGVGDVEFRPVPLLRGGAVIPPAVPAAVPAVPAVPVGPAVGAVQVSEGAAVAPGDGGRVWGVEGGFGAEGGRGEPGRHGGAGRVHHHRAGDGLLGGAVVADVALDEDPRRVGAGVGVGVAADHGELALGADHPAGGAGAVAPVDG